MKKLLLITLLLIVGCSKEPINYETTLIERDGVFYTNDTNEPYSGPVFSLYDDGKKKEEGTYKDGKEDGLWSYWYENGKKEQEGTFKDGEKDGKWTYRYPPVEIYGHPDELVITKEEGTYKDGEKDGKWTFWNYKGEKKGEGTFKDGKKDGLWSYSYDDEQKILDVTFKDGVENGLWTQWYHNGKKRYEGNIKGEEGFRTEWYENGQKKSEEKNVKIFPNYPFSLPPSLKFKRLSVIRSYSNRTIDRLYTKWYENGQKKEDWDINDGDGKVTYWFDNGQKSSEDTYKDGENISSKCWDEDGNECECGPLKSLRKSLTVPNR